MAQYTKGKRGDRGSIDVLPSGALRVRVYAGVDPISKRELYLTETVPAGPQADREAKKVRTRLLNQVDERRNPRTRATLGQLLDEYLKVANLDPGTLRGYERNRKNHVDPLLGSEKLAKINAQVLDAFYAELRRCRFHCNGTPSIDHRTDKQHVCDDRCKPHVCEGLAPSTVRRIHFLLSGAFKRAVRWGWVGVNPCSAAEPPAEPKPEPQPPTPEEAARIVNAAWQDSDWGTLVWLAMTTGARRAELCALRWRHLNLDVGTISLNRSVDQNGAEITEKDTKTHQHRRIALDPDTIGVLREHRTNWEERAAALGVTLSPDAFVFSLAPDGSKELKPDTVTQRYGRLAERLGIATTFHKLRHFSATELITAGVDPRTVGGRLGHAGGGTTTLRVYSAWVAETDQRAANTLSTRMPARPLAPVDRVERAKTEPEAPYEKIAAVIRQQILDGSLTPGSPAPTQKEIRKMHNVSAGTANRVVDLLKQWNLVDATRGRRAVVLAPSTDGTSRSVDAPVAVAPLQEVSRNAVLDLRLVFLGKAVRSFSSEADPSDAGQLRRLLLNAVRRHGGANADPSDYELEVRRAGASDLITSYAAF